MKEWILRTAGEIYIGRTKKALKDALFRHSEGLSKWSHLSQSQYTIDQLVLQGKTVLFDITDIKAWKGMEELMIQGYKSLGKEFAGGLNKIHGRNPLKKQKYKESILAARDWLRKPIYEDMLKEFQKDWGKSLDELVEEIFKKYNIQ